MISRCRIDEISAFLLLKNSIFTDLNAPGYDTLLTI